MKQVLVLGAGRSATSLINYLLDHAEAENWSITVADHDEAMAKRKVDGAERGTAMAFDARNSDSRRELIASHDLVISMLPARMHIDVVKDCIDLKTHIITPSYISEEMKALDADAKKAGIWVLNEMGLDPGIDHMSAMQVIDRIKAEGGEMTSFESFTGGLVAPESDNNPWNYKFTWNPRNVVLAGQGGTVKFIQEGKYKYIPYHKLFRRTERIEIKNFGKYEGYANRDSLSYRSIYGLENIPTIFRGTLRRPGFCRSWDIFIQMGMTDDSYEMEGVANMTHRDFVNSFLAYSLRDSVELKFKYYLNLSQDEDHFMDRFVWLGLFSDEKVGLDKGTPAQILQHLLEKKWALAEDDKDMIVMWHKFGYKINGEQKEINASMVMLGKNQDETAMALTVGLPLAIIAKLMLQGKINRTGVELPIYKEIYEPVLAELAELGCTFQEEHVAPTSY
jgi:saccharopine dehydrogenase-like NADP-dependent oxidoreductase